LIKVLYILPWLKTGGSETYVLNLAKSMDPKEFEVLVWCRGEWGPIGDELGKLGVKVMEGPMSPYRPGQLLAFWRYIRRERVDIVHSLNYRPNPTDAIVTKLALKKFVSSRRNMRHWEGGQKLHLGERIRNRFTDKVVANSSAVSRLTTRLENVPLRKIVVIYNGVPFDELEQWSAMERGIQLRTQLNIDRKSFVVVNVANLRHVKGQMYLLKAFQESLPKLPPNSHLIICGEGEEQGNLETYINTNDLQNSVHIIHSTDKYGVMAAADVFVLPSLGEGFSNAIIEAMSMGLPIIATSVGGNAEAVVDGLNGIIVPPANAEKLSDAILRTAMNNVRRKDMGAKSRERAKADFTLDRMASAHEHLYSSLVRGK